jgi:hypothetical protein
MVLQTSVSALANLCDNFIVLFEVLAIHMSSSKGLFISLFAFCLSIFLNCYFDTILFN